MSDKCVGIITFHTAINYGAVLQAVALENALKELGISCEIIDYQNARFAKQYGLQMNFQSKNFVKKAIAFLVKNFFFLQKKIKFRNFLNTNADLSKKKYNFYNVVNCESAYDYFVTGSDQVWNLSLTDGDTRYFLDFVPEEKKRSYAASFGKNKIEAEFVNIYKELLIGFKEISLRERSAIDIFHQLHIEKELFVHIDPTLLFDGRWWEKLCKNTPKYKYILFYKVAIPDKLVNYVEDFSSKTGMQVIEIGSDLRKSSKKFKMIRSASPEKFISLIKNAEYVATTSFHATVFAILFHKKMFLELTDKTGKFNVRISNLLRTLSIDINDIDKILHTEFANWEKVDMILKELRTDAFSYLRTME